MKILALCGSLRKQSRSLALLKATQILVKSHVKFVIHEGIGDLPLFNPDIEHTAPESVHALWQAVSWADVIVIASPEYAHGMTGTIKNALDWLVGYIPFAGKPVAVFNPTYRSEHADEAIKETLRTMDARLISTACVRIPVIGCKLSNDELAREPAFANIIQTALAAIERHV